MPIKNFGVEDGASILKMFESGLEAWEQPVRTSEAEESLDVRDTKRARQGVRVRAAVKTRNRITSTDSPAVTPALPPDDSAVENFRSGLTTWERPFETGRENDG
jgi:hypothetical protein